MPPIRRQRKSPDTKQRSFHLTDDVYNIVEREAAHLGISNSAWVSNVIQNVGDAVARQKGENLDGSPRRETYSALPADATPAAPQPSKRAEGIVLPDESVSEFAVDRAAGAVRGKRLKSDSELSGVEGGAPKKRNRREEINL